jgi:hypothetical protein
VASADSDGQTPGRSRWSKAAPRAFAVLVLVVYAVLCWREVNSGLEFDESYNLTVVMHLADGAGYASGGGLKATELLPFDPYVTTGPALLAPMAGVWGLTGSLEATRLVSLAFFVLYLTAAWTLGRRIAGVAGGLAALASPLFLAVGVRDVTTLSLVPGRFVGELPACALLMAAVVLLPHKRLAVAAPGGLCAGLAIQTKLSFLAAAGIVGLVWLVADLRAAGRPRWGRWLAVGMGAALPTLAFELYRWRSLGDGYGASIEAQRTFISFQTQYPGFRASGARAKTFPDLLSGPGLTLLVLACLAAVVLEVLRRSRRAGVEASTPEPELRVSRALIAAQFVAALVLGAVWILNSVQPSIRQGLPTLLLALPVVAALVAGSLTRPGEPARGTRVTAVLTGTALVVVTVYAGTRIVLGGDSNELLDQQRTAARVIEESGTPSLPIEAWWTLPQFQVLTDLPKSTSPSAEPPTIRVFDATRAALDLGTPDARRFSDLCSEELYVGWGVLVCR